MDSFLRQLLLLLLLAVLSVEVQAQSKIIRYSKSGDTLEVIAQRFLPAMTSQYGHDVEEYKRDLTKWNPHIRDWKNLSAETPFYISYPYQPFLPGPYGADVLALPNSQNLPEGESSFKNTFFYMASVGHFSEQTAGNQNVKSFQNSPVSLGIGTLFKIEEYRKYLMTSFYWSKLIASDVEGQVSNSENKISLPNEYGMNLYYQQRIAETSFSAYTGIDHENFATYNTSELVPGSLLEVRTNNLFYVTAGLSRPFTLWGYQLNSKLSVSQSLLSKSSTGNSSDRFKGNRFLLFASLKKTGPFSVQFLYKHHSLTGPTELSIDRIGLGASYEF